MKAITCIGNAEDPNAWSGIPNSFLSASRAQDFATIGWKLNPNRLLARKIAWNVKEVLLTLHKGGFQYTREFMCGLYKQVPEIERIEVISHFPLLPDLNEHKCDGNFYLDATLRQNMIDYGIQKVISPRIMLSAIDWEKDQYQAAKKIFCMSSYAANSVINEYGINPAKVYIIPAGANLTVEQLRALSSPTSYKKDFKKIKLGFIGKDWNRKGLPYILRVAEVLNSRKIDVGVIAAGFNPVSGPRHALLHSIGFIDKKNNFQKYLEFMQKCHFGCLFSYAEAFGISNREFLAAGIPIIGFNIGGIQDTVPSDFGHLFQSDTSPEEVADKIKSYVENEKKYDELTKKIKTEQELFTWKYTVMKISQNWQDNKLKLIKNND